MCEKTIMRSIMLIDLEIFNRFYLFKYVILDNDNDNVCLNYCEFKYLKAYLTKYTKLCTKKVFEQNEKKNM